MTVERSLLFLNSKLSKNISNKIGHYSAERIVSHRLGKQGIYISRSCGFSEFSTTSPAANKTLVDGINLHWEKFGNGPHIVLCLPGLASSIAQDFVPVSQKMNLEKFTLIAWDPPGYGGSRPPEREILTKEFCLETDARLAGKLMKELGYEKYSTLGWSNGGTTGALLAAQFPAAVHKSVMCNSPCLFAAHAFKIMKIMVELKNWTPSQRKSLLDVYDEAYAVKMLHDWKKVIKGCSKKPREHSKYLTLQMNKIRAPTLFIRSMQDIAVPMEDAEEFGNLIRNFKLHKVAEGGHSHLEFLDEFVTAAENFLSAPK